MKILKIMLLLALVSCSHHHKEMEHHHQKETAFKIDHGGKTYYFDSESEKEKFAESIKSDIHNPKCKKKGRNLICR